MTEPLDPVDPIIPDPETPVTENPAAAPVVVTSIDPLGLDYTQLQVSWPSVTEYEDGSPVIVASYEVHVSVNGGPMSLVTSVPGTQLTAVLPRYVAGTEITWAVRAIPVAGVPGDLSEPQLVTTTGPDLVGPPAPSRPLVTSKLGIVSVRWDGGFVGGPKPDDFLAVDVHISPTSSFTPSASTLAGQVRAAATVQLVGQALGATRYVKLVARDVRGNPSQPSAEASVLIVGVTGPDIEANSVTANKLSAGAIDGMVITGATIRTSADPTRVEFDNSGFRMLKAGQPTVNFDAATGAALVTGEIRTDIPSKANIRMFNTGQPGSTGFQSNEIQFWPEGNTIAKASPARIRVSNTVYSDGRDVFVLSSDQVSAQGDARHDLMLSGAGVDVFHQESVALGGQYKQIASIRSGDMEFNSGTFSVYADHASGNSPDGITLATEGHITVAANASMDSNIYGNYSVNLNGGFFVRVPVSGVADPTSPSVFQVTAGGTYLRTLSTTTNPVNLAAVGSFNNIQKVVSLSQYKLEQQSIPVDYGILDLDGKTWIDKGHREQDSGYNRRTPGFIAEEVAHLSQQHDHAFDALLLKSDQDELEGVAYDRALAYVLPVVKDMAARLDRIEAHLGLARDTS